MPELPEVGTVRVGLSQLIPGKRIKGLIYDWPKSFPNPPEIIDAVLIGSEVIDVRRRAKVLIIDLDSGYSLVIHLKMTGQMVYKDVSYRFGAGHPNDSLIGNLPDKSTRVEITFEDNSKLFFNDQRKFGWMKVVATPEIFQLPFFLKVGPEPLESDFTGKLFIGRIRKRNNSNIKAALLDQSVLAGIGNIYADESLWLARIHPLTKVSRLTDRKLRLLHGSLIEVLRLSIEKGGSTDRNYVNAEGKKGSYIEFANVFRKEGQPCPRCGREIIKIRAAGRGTHICSYCQKVNKQ
jgi:formamidopyrimidine-DNA glycosylase